MNTFQQELASIRALPWDQQPAALEALCSDYAASLAHREAELARMKKCLDKKDR